MGIESDYVTFPSMMPLKGKKSRKRPKKRFSHIKHYPLFSSMSQPLIFFEMFMSIRQLGY